MSVPARRARARDGVRREAKRLIAALDALCGPEDDLDLDLERYDRVSTRLHHALRDFEDLLARSEVPPPRQTGYRLPRTPLT